MMLTLEFDGLFRGAPDHLHLNDDAGFLCYGWVILRDGVVIARGHGGYARAQSASSNVAEYLALIEGLEALLDLHATEEIVMVCGDAKSIIEQMEGYAHVSATSIVPLHRRAARLARQFRSIYWEWTPRRYNHTADSLTRRALSQIRAIRGGHDRAFLNHGQPSAKLRSLLDLRMFQCVPVLAPVPVSINVPVRSRV
jgi:ribonuclease HI